MVKVNLCLIVKVSSQQILVTTVKKIKKQYNDSRKSEEYSSVFVGHFLILEGNWHLHKREWPKANRLKIPHYCGNRTEQWIN